MAKLLIFTTVLLSLLLTRAHADVSSLQDQNGQDHLDPVQDQDQDLSSNSQDKRTICGALKCSSSDSSGAQVKHVFVKSGLRHRLVANVVRPVGYRAVGLGGYRYPKPKIHFRLKAPSSLRPIFGSWTPVVSGSRAVVHEVKPQGHVDVVHNNPVPHVDHVQTVHHDVAAPVHVDHVHLQPNHVHLQPNHVHLQPVQHIQPNHVHLQHVQHVQPIHVHPVVPQGAHVDEVHQIRLQHGNHIDSFTHLDHVHQTAVPLVQAVVPIAPQPTLIKPFAPTPVLYEVTRPNLGVLPFGARFPSPILPEVPHVHHAVLPHGIVHEPEHHPHFHAAPVAQHHHHHLHQPVQGIIQTHVGLPHIAPQPGLSVEYHETRNFVPVGHQTPVQPLPPTIFGLQTAHAHQQVPFEHAHHGFVTEQRLPNDHAAHGFVAQQQLMPHEHAAHGFVSQQQLPHDHAAHGFVAQQQLPHDHAAQGFVTQQQLPHDHAAQGFVAQQQLPHDHQAQGFVVQQQQQQQLPHEHQVQFSADHQLQGNSYPHFSQSQTQPTHPYQDIPPGQLPLEGQFFQGDQDVQNFNENNVIQPGRTDLQIPYYLPQHQGWDGASGYAQQQSQQQQQQQQQEETGGFGDQSFRPSPQLEAPYQK